MPKQNAKSMFDLTASEHRGIALNLHDLLQARMTSVEHLLDILERRGDLHDLLKNQTVPS